jgi:hypothetical protein
LPDEIPNPNLDTANLITQTLKTINPDLAQWTHETDLVPDGMVD